MEKRILTQKFSDSSYVYLNHYGDWPELKDGVYTDMLVNSIMRALKKLYDYECLNDISSEQRLTAVNPETGDINLKYIKIDGFFDDYSDISLPHIQRAFEKLYKIEYELNGSHDGEEGCNL